MQGRTIQGIFLGFLISVFPFSASAQNMTTLLGTVGELLNGMIYVLISLAIVVFFWGIIRYLASVGEKKSEGLTIMLWGVITIFVMVSIWGIIRILQNTTGTGGVERPDINLDPEKHAPDLTR